jgi:HEAT repeat protein
MKVFVAALQNRDKTVRKMAYTNLPNIVAYNKSAGCLLPFLLENLKRDASEIGNYYGPAWLLGLMGPRAKEALPALVEILKSDDNERVKIGVAMALAELKAVAAPAIPALREASTNDASEKVRDAAKSALHQIPP